MYWRERDRKIGRMEEKRPRDSSRMVVAWGNRRREIERRDIDSEYLYGLR